MPKIDAKLIIPAVLILIIIIILVFVLLRSTGDRTNSFIVGLNKRRPESFDDFWYRTDGLNMYYDQYYNTHTNFPFWNTQLGSKRLMSYDLRGDIPVTRSYTGPWLNSSRGPPIYNKPLWMVS